MRLVFVVGLPDKTVLCLVLTNLKTCFVLWGWPDENNVFVLGVCRLKLVSFGDWPDKQLCVLGWTIENTLLLGWAIEKSSFVLVEIKSRCVFVGAIASSLVWGGQLNTVWFLGWRSKKQFCFFCVVS